MVVKKVSSDIMLVTDLDDVLMICEALSNRTRLKVIELLKSGDKDLETLSMELNLSKGNLSTQIKKLENIGVVSSSYLPGEKGVKKVVKLKIREIRIIL